MAHARTRPTGPERSFKNPPRQEESHIFRVNTSKCGDEEVQDLHVHQDPERSSVLNGHREEMRMTQEG